MTAFFLNAQSGNRTIDSLLQKLKTVSGDTNKIKILNNLGWEFKSVGDYDTAFFFVKEGLALSQKLEHSNVNSVVRAALRGEAKAFSILGSINASIGNYEEALKNHFAAKNIQQKIGDKQSFGMSLNNIGIVYNSRGNYIEALKNHLVALKIREEMNDKINLAVSYNNIGIVYRNSEKYADALKNHLLSLKIKKEIGDKKGMAASYNNIGLVYFDMGNKDSSERNKLFSLALENYLTAVTLNEESGNKNWLANNYMNIGNVFNGQNKLDEALKKYSEALKIKQKMGDQAGIAASLLSIGTVCNKLKKYSDAEKYCMQSLALAEKMGELNGIRLIHETLYAIYYNTKKFDKALIHYKKFISTRDSLINEENTKKQIRLEMNFEFDKKEAAAKLQQEKKEAVTAAENKKQKVILFSVVGCLLLVACFAVFAYRSFLQKKKANISILKQKEIIEEKQREILDSIYYARRIQRALLTPAKYIERKLNELN